MARPVVQLSQEWSIKLAQPSSSLSPLPSPSPSPPPESRPSPPLSTVTIPALSTGSTEKLPSIKLHRPGHRCRPLCHPSALYLHLIRRHYLTLFAMPIEDEFVDFKAFKAAMSGWSVTGKHKFRLARRSSTVARRSTRPGSDGKTKVERRGLQIWIHCQVVT